MNTPGRKTLPAPVAKRATTTFVLGDPCPQCGEADLEQMGGKHRCPICAFLQPVETACS